METLQIKTTLIKKSNFAPPGIEQNSKKLHHTERITSSFSWDPGMNIGSREPQMEGCSTKQLTYTDPNGWGKEKLSKAKERFLIQENAEI